ncbi:hypothetical protein JCM4814A_01210 [Streptomyces phaeofaciens JCM 4814]|jgi:hypothetical protein|uniref:Uncharacterized protein n=1 Tax=Streptomyces phaeofaciens TaxID=68254 RepID=A0A918HPL0_9ACTN|nr:hypothetical protein GCM10010226_82370 [Streptomyces phaeofaciens]
MQSPDRSAIATAAIGSALACFVAYAYPALVPALTVGLAVWVALYAFLKL